MMQSDHAEGWSETVFGLFFHTSCESRAAFFAALLLK
jgi:hypothetical protein